MSRIVCPGFACIVNEFAQNRNVFPEQRIDDLFPQAPEHQQKGSEKGENDSGNQPRRAVIHFDSVIAGFQVDAEQGVTHGNNICAFAVDGYRPALAVGNGGEHDAVLVGGDRSLEVSVAVLGDIPLLFAHGGYRSVQRVIVHFGDEDISAAGGC